MSPARGSSPRARGLPALLREAWRAVRDGDPWAWLFPWPPYCLGCGAELPGWPATRPALCATCHRQVVFRPRSRCPSCDRPAWLADAGRPCSECRNLGPPWQTVRALGPYDGLLRRLVLRMKYGEEPYVAALLGRLLAERVTAWPRDLLVVPIPLHPARLRERGFNQALLLATHLARASGRPLAPHALRRLRQAPPQAMLGAAARRSNVEAVFAPRPGRRLGGRPVLLVDDVLTTGRTLAAACQALQLAGAGPVFGAVAAVTPLWPGGARPARPAGSVPVPGRDPGEELARAGSSDDGAAPAEPGRAVLGGLWGDAEGLRRH